MRQFIYDTLRLDPDIAAIVDTRIFQGESMDHAELERPFLVYRLGNETNELFSEDAQMPHREFFQVYIHDNPADYMRIDELAQLVRRALVGGPHPAYKILRVNYLETSRDLDDDVMRTIMRYVRFQAVRSDY